MPGKAKDPIWADFSDEGTCRHCGAKIHPPVERMRAHVAECAKAPAERRAAAVEAAKLAKERKKKKEELKAHEEKLKKEAKAVKQSTLIVKREKTTEEQIQSALRDVFYANALPLWLVEEYYMGRFLDLLNVKPPSRKTLSTTLLDTDYAEEWKRCVATLRSADVMTLHSDGYTVKSPLTHVQHFTAVTSGMRTELRTVVLTEETHDAAELLRHYEDLLACLRQEGVTAVVVAVVSDAGAACMSASKQFAEKIGAVWIRCCVHQLNRGCNDLIGERTSKGRVVKNEFAPENGVIAALMVHLRGGERLQKRFFALRAGMREEAASGGLPGPGVCTRFLSHFPQWECVVDYRDVIMALNAPELEPQCAVLRDEQQAQVLQLVRRLLEWIHLSVCFLERDSSRLGHVIPVFDRLLTASCDVKRAAAALGREVEQRFSRTHELLKKRRQHYASQQPVQAATYLTSSFHDPMIKYKEKSLEQKFLEGAAVAQYRDAAVAYVRGKLQDITCGQKILAFASMTGSFAQPDLWDAAAPLAPEAFWKMLPAAAPELHALASVAAGVVGITPHTCQVERVFSRFSWVAAPRRRSLDPMRMAKLATLAAWRRQAAPQRRPAAPAAAPAPAGALPEAAEEEMEAEGQPDAIEVVDVDDINEVDDMLSEGDEEMEPNDADVAAEASPPRRRARRCIVIG